MTENTANTTDAGSGDRTQEGRLAWALAIAGLLLALAAAGYLTLKDPRPTAATAPPTPAGRSAVASQTSTVPTQPLTVADVRAVLGDLDYVTSAESSRAAYDRAVVRLTRSVDLPSFALATLQATSTIHWTDLGQSSARAVTGAEKDALTAEAIQRWREFAAEEGDEEAPLADVFASTLYPPTVPDRNRVDSLTDVTAQGLKPLGLLFGAQQPSLGWSWKVAEVSIAGTDTAEVTYEVATSPDAGFTLANPPARFTKRLRFARSAIGRWRLFGWLNYWDVQARFRGSVRPLGAEVRTDRWWGAL
jgi:hypothetical protein